MCLLTFIPKGVTPNRDRFARAAITNPDGFGFAIHDGYRILTDKDMDFDKLWERWTIARKSHAGPALFHFRITTHGKTDLTNCHPFRVGGDDLSVLGHNGILPIEVPVHDDRSDTHLFAQYVLPEIGGVPALDNESVFDQVSQWARGSKMVVLSVNPLAQYDWYIINEQEGHWSENMWWSNYSYVPRNYGYGGYGGWGTTRIDGYDWYKDSKTKQDDIDATPAPSAAPVKTRDPWDEQSEVLDCWTNELYDGDYAERFIEFVDIVSDTMAIATCPYCQTSFEVDPLAPMSTHCGECGSCFVCGDESGGCGCWDDYSYGKSHLVQNEDGTGTALVFETPDASYASLMGVDRDW